MTLCYDPALPRQPAIPFSAILRGAMVRPCRNPYALPNWQWVFSTLYKIHEDSISQTWLEHGNLMVEDNSPEDSFGMGVVY